MPLARSASHIGGKSSSVAGTSTPASLEERRVVPEELELELERHHVQRTVVEALVVQRGLAVVLGEPEVIEQQVDVDHAALLRELLREGRGIRVEELGQLVRGRERLVLLDVRRAVGRRDEVEREAGVLLRVLVGDLLHRRDHAAVCRPREQPGDLAGHDLALRGRRRWGRHCSLRPRSRSARGLRRLRRRQRRGTLVCASWWIMVGISFDRSAGGAGCGCERSGRCGDEGRRRRRGRWLERCGARARRCSSRANTENSVTVTAPSPTKTPTRPLGRS